MKRWTPEEWRSAGGFVVGDSVCYFDKVAHHHGTVKRVGKKPTHIIAVTWDSAAPHLSAAVYPHILHSPAQCAEIDRAAAPTQSNPDHDYWVSQYRVADEDRRKALTRIGHCEEWVRAEIAEIDADERHHYKPADVRVNAPLALEQVGMSSRMQVLKKVLELLGGKS